MGFFDRLKDQVNPFDGGRTFNSPQRQAQSPQRVAQPQYQKDPMSDGYPPDITYDPTGRTPYSARTPELAKMGNRYTANPTSPEFRNVDPAQFGYPADNTVQLRQQNSLDILKKLLGY